MAAKAREKKTKPPAPKPPRKPRQKQPCQVQDEPCVALVLFVGPALIAFQFDKETLDAVIAELIAARNNVWPTP